LWETSPVAVADPANHICGFVEVKGRLTFKEIEMAINRVADRPAAKAVIVVRGDQTEPVEKETDRDPVYGNALADTWKWLNAKATLGVFDFGVAAVREATTDTDFGPLNAPAADAPVLFPAHLDCWVQTHPRPTPDPDPALFLHGPKQPGQPDVQVVFRDDLGDDSTQWAEIVALCPPSSSEAVAVPISVFRKWMTGELGADDTADVEGGTPEEAEADDEETPTRFALRWRGPDKSKPISLPKEVTPNDVYVVPCTGGIDGLGDFPPGPVADYAEEAFQRSRDKALLRLPKLVIPEDTNKVQEAALVTAAIRDLQASLKPESPDWQRRAVEHFLEPQNLRRREVDQHPLGGFVITGKSRLRQFDPTHLDDSEPAESFRGVAVTLEDHSRGVADYAKRFAAGCGLDVTLYTQAGLWHDLGKLDPRFQAMLKQSSPRTAVGVALAKSARSARTTAEKDQARQVHHYPKGARHELLSAALVAGRNDDDLLLHLIATHHGSARPFADPVGENAAAATPFEATLFGETFRANTSAQEIGDWNAELPERFWRVVRKHGWWAAAYQEAVFRLADHTQSAAEQDSTPTPTELATGWVALPANATRLALHRLPLPGLDGANPLAFLAALGTLRLADELFPGAKLTWERISRWQPVLMLSVSLTNEEFALRIHSHVHRTPNVAANQTADDRHKIYRKQLKEMEKAVESVKERRLRGAEREAAIFADVAPLRSSLQAARLSWLQALGASVSAPYLSLGKSIAVSGEEFSAFAARAAERLHEAGASGRAESDFTPAFGCEACLDKYGRVIPTELQLITGSGHQFFLVTFGTLMESVTAEQFHRSLFGPWTYADLRLSFRWDPLDDRRYAVSWGDPSSTEVRTEHGANLLAAFALPYFPNLPTSHGARTTGFNTESDETILTWPIWELPRSRDAIKSLLSLAALQEEKPSHQRLYSSGASLGFRVRKFEVGRPPLSKLNLCSSVTV